MQELPEPPHDGSLRSHIRDFIENLRFNRNVSEHTARAYESDLEQFLTLINAHIPLRMSDEDFERTATLLAAAKESYEKQVNGSFVVVFHPGWNHTKPYHGHEKLLVLLDEKNVTVWDYSGFPYVDEKHTFVCDPHPNAAFNSEFASLLARKLA